MAHFLLRLFVKNADQTSDPKVRAAVGTLSGIVGILCNFFLFLGKVIIGTLSGSVSITADAMNNLSDAASSIVTLVGFKLAEQPADAEHPYGHARFEYLSGLVVSAMIVIIGFELAKTSVGKILSPVPVVFSAPLAAVLVLLFVYLYKQLRRVYRIKEELSQTNAKLARLNEELGEKNEQLSDSNAVKVQYIARFFDLCSMYIDKMDDYRKSLKKLAQDRKFDELNRRLKSTSMLEDEQDELYKNFDAIFLNLYPSFVEDFNALLTEDERIVLKQEDLLNKELRIYALLRLGITDSVKIASFLRCSLSTVYNYRTKVRNKAAISREEFEKMVMKIGTAHKTDV